MIKKTNIFLVLYLLLFSVLVVYFPSLQPPISLSLFCVSEKKQEKVNKKHKGRSFSIAEHYSASAECGKMQLRSIPAKKYLYLHTYNYRIKEKIHFSFLSKVYSSPKELNISFDRYKKQKHYVNVE